MYRHLHILILVLLIPFVGVRAQAIEFGQYYDGATLEVEVPEWCHLDFGEVELGDTGTVSIGDVDQGCIEITGIRFLDVVVTITKPTHLTLNGNPCLPENITSCAMVLNLQTSYNNRSTFEDYFSAVSFTSSTITFPLAARMGGPPVPPTPSFNLPENVNLPTSTSYIYFYGSVVSNINNQGGSYTASIEIEVEYF